jgi:nitroimidazol reductase NimA-like FMN-containing flavoprotein (pyridoxamine 5'-phosphate oxidase superfamily)
MSAREEILEILKSAQDLTLATLREDGYPHATTVSYANDGLNIYFGCSPASQKARNLARNNRVSLTINLPYAHWGEIRGLSLAGRAELLEKAERDVAARLLLRKFPQGVAEYASGSADDVAFFRIRPEVISLLDYRKGFGHTELVRTSQLDT